VPDHREGVKAQRIALLVSSMGRGGAERVAATLCNAWAREGREAWLIPTFLGSREIAYPLDEAVHVHFLAQSFAATASQVPTPLRKVFLLRQLLRKAKPDVIVSFLPSTNVLAVAASRGLGIPLVVCERADPAADTDLHPALRIARLIAYPFADRLCVQTRQAAERMRWLSRLCGKPEIIPNPLPQSLVSPSLRIRQHPRFGIIIAVGRLSPEKGFDGLLRAFHLGFRDAPEWKLEIWGEGPQRASLEALIQELRLESRIKICGHTTDPWSAMVRAQLFALTSAYEGFPNAMLEAMALGLPAVAYDCNSGPRDLTDGGRVGRLVPPGNEVALAQTLRDLADDPGRRKALGDAGAEFVAAQFSLNSVMARWDEVFAGMIARHPKNPSTPC
jgi:GalNAc-alpha-(1->4)-GalNAc-alpha-(1->3)-diNAcBac-PP-undecaprenol alpha-1,4-N-acetyl-D-galactosaminyltransferase